MLVVEKKRKLVINTSRHGDVMAVIPHAKLFDYNGARLLAMHHGIEETLILRNLGFRKTPAPILSYYDFPARFTAMQHQKSTAAFLSSNKRALCLNAPGTGKSISALWAADYLMLEGIIKTVLIVAPLSTLKPVWGIELRHHFPHRNVAMIVGTKSKRAELLQTAGLQYAIINHDGFTTMHKELVGKFDLVIYDECFIAGTKVTTPVGQKNIETLSVGEEVLTSSGVQRIKRLKRSTSDNLIVVRLDNGKQITCTRNHPFFTDAGWVTADNLAGRRLISEDALSDMRQGISIPKIEVAKLSKEQQELRHELLNILQVEENQCANTNDGVMAVYPRKQGKKPCHIFSEQAYSVRRNAAENIKYNERERSSTTNTRRERNRNDYLRETSSRDNANADLELYNSIGTEAARLSYKLQSRLCDSAQKNSTRSRRVIAHNETAQRAGYKEDESISGIRVVSVSDYEQTGSNTVYNLEIEGTPNYFVENILVHNCTALKTPTSNRYRLFAKWVQANNPWLWLMTGTPIAQNPTDAWTLAKLVNSPIVPSSFTAFKELVMRKVSMFKWAPREDALLTCKKVLQPSIRFSLDECMDLPETVYLDHKSELSSDQLKAFKAMQKDCVSVLSEGTATAANAAVMFSKLLQICSGAVYSESGEVLNVDATDRCDTLQEVLTEVGGKCIVFVPFRGVQAYLFDMLTKAGHEVALVNGSVGKKERDAIFEAFQNSDKYNVLLAHPQVAAHGLTLTRSQDVIWFAPIYSLEQYEQANARIRRLTTSGKTRVHHLYSTTFEKELYSRLQHKQRTLNDFLTLVRGTNE